jgi:hypothetical protein
MPTLLINPRRRNKIFIPEVAQRVNPPNSQLSNYLEDLVHRGLVPRPIAETMNRLPSENLQRDVVQRFWARQRFEGWKDLGKTNRRLGSTSKILYSTLAGVCIAVLVKSTRFLPPQGTSLATPRTTFSHSHARRLTPVRTQAAPVHRRPTVIKKPVPRVVDAKVVPTNFVVHRQANNIRFSWRTMGPGFTYTLYVGEGPAMVNLHKVMEGISDSVYTLNLPNSQQMHFWWAISATNAYGGEGPLSGAVLN